jgi:hypothetical protein
VSVGAGSGRGRPSRLVSSAATASTSSAAIERKVVNFPPAIVNIPPGPRRMMCSRLTTETRVAAVE